MGIRTYRAGPLAKFFIVLRILQMMLFTATIGLASYIISNIRSQDGRVSKVICFTLIIVSLLDRSSRLSLVFADHIQMQTCLAFLYTLLTIPFFFSNGTFSLIGLCVMDILFLVGFAIISFVIGPELSYMNCFDVKTGSMNNKNAWGLVSSFEFSGTSALNGNFNAWIRASRGACLEGKAVWGLCIAICILLLLSALVLPGLFAKKKRAMRAEKVEDDKV